MEVQDSVYGSYIYVCDRIKFYLSRVILRENFSKFVPKIIDLHHE